MSLPFTSETLSFLRGLIRHNDREWFEARREIYERAVKAPMIALIEEVNAAMAEFAPEHVRTPAKTMLRIYRDTRFSKDKRPYKKHVSAWFGRRGAVGTTGAGFYVHVSPVEVVLAAGVFMPTAEQLLAIRRWMAEHHAEYGKMLTAAARSNKSSVPLEPAEVQALTRMPKGFAADHPAGEFLRARRWGVSASLGPDQALDPEFAKTVIQCFQASAPIALAFDEAEKTASSKNPAKSWQAPF